MVTNVGPFPRDVMDTRLMNKVEDETFDPNPIDEDNYNDAFLIDDENSNVVDSDDDGMPDYWESKIGLNNSVQDHNGTNLSSIIYGINGYSNLEVYLNCLSDALVNGISEPCGIELNPIVNTDYQKINNLVSISPNPAMNFFSIKSDQTISDLTIYNVNGVNIKEKKPNQKETMVEVSELPYGIYLVKLKLEDGKSISKKLVLAK